MVMGSLNSANQQFPGCNHEKQDYAEAITDNS
jgi:hypothetical protein